MDLIAACRVLVEVDERGSITRAAAALRMAQSVASRRIFALEERLGSPLLDRSTQRAALTPFGRGVVPSARRLVQLADEFELDAERALLQPAMLAVPESCSTRDLAVAIAAGRAAGFDVEFQRAAPARRVELVNTQMVRVAVVAVPHGDGVWRVPLGAASRRRHDTPLRLDALRPPRTGRGSQDDDAGARLRIGPEDDVPHVRDVINHEAFGAGLLPGQLPIDTSTMTSLAWAVGNGDLLLCSAAEAAEMGLHWRPFSDPTIARGYELAAGNEHDAHTIAEVINEELSVALGAAHTAKDVSHA